jgi:hypothetical protein
MLNRAPHSPVVRDVLALVAALSLVWWSGPVSISGGFGGWLIGVALCLLTPLVICLAASRFPFLSVRWPPRAS